jgi:hypothetical protein
MSDFFSYLQKEDDRLKLGELFKKIQLSTISSNHRKACPICP